MSLLPNTLTDFNYYKRKLPLYLRNDEAFLSHFKIWFDFLIGEIDNSNDGLEGAGEKLLNLIDIFESDYLEKLSELENYTDNSSDFLDKLGSIFNIRRNFSVSYKPEDSEVIKTFELNLNNEEFLLFIKSQIIKNYSDGSYYQMRQFYDSAGLNIYFGSDDNSNAEVRVYLLDTSVTIYSDNIKHLFNSGLLTIKSMGIGYNHSIQQYSKMLVWDKEVDENYTGWATDNEDTAGEWVL